jgi:signal transduction histidine kinase/ligand-binding sensor domain-containing protein
MCAYVERARRLRRTVIAPGILVLGMLLACCPCASALDPSLAINQYAHTAWTIREGISKGFINSIAQTPDGYLWLATEFGLLRFDGVRSVPWQPPAGQHLPGSDIYRLLAARDGTLWIGTRTGLASWKDGKLTQYPELAGKAVFRLIEDREGTVWAGGYVGLCAIHIGNVLCYGADGSFGIAVTSLYQDSGGNLWVGSTTGLWRWKPGPPKLYPIQATASSIEDLIESDDGALLIAKGVGIKQLVDGNAEKYSLPGVAQSFSPARLLRDRNGGLWIGTQDRGLLHMYHGRTDMFAQSDGLSSDHITSLFEDREGTVWAATDNGLDRFRDFAVTTISVKQGLSIASTGSVLAGGDGSVWVGSYKGLNRWKNGQLTIYRERSARAPGRAREITDSGLPDNAVESLGQDDHGRIWVSTLRGLAYFENGRFIPVSGVPVTSGYVHSIVTDKVGNLWISHDQGLFHFHRESLVERIPWAKLGHKEPATTLFPDPGQGGLWLGFLRGGVAHFKEGQIYASHAGADTLDESYVTGLQLDRDGTLWAATEGGLSRVKQGRVATLTSKNGLPCDAVHWMMEDDDHSVWLYTACGLVRIARPQFEAWANAVDKGVDKDPNQTIQVTVFDTSDGVRNTASHGGFNPRVAKSKDGKIWFSGEDGVGVIDPRHIPFNKLPPPIHIEQITADRKTYDATLDGPGDVKRHMRLPPLVRDLQIDYTALSFVAPEKVLFRYKLEGRDRDWQDVGNRRQAFYGNLSPGNYRFRVIACNNSGVWNEAGTFLDFSIPPAYYQGNWFRVSCVAAFFVLLWALYQLRLRQIARLFQMRLEERLGERTRIARELHDTLLQGFQGLMFRLQAVRYLLPERPAEASQALDTALDLGGEVIAEGRDAVQNLRSSTVVNNDLVHGLTILAEELAAPKGSAAAPTFRMLVEGPPRDLDPICRDDIYRIAREALVNAFHHARAQKIEAEITYGDPQFRLRIRDDGTGIDSSVRDGGKCSGHWGLTGMRERAKTIGGRLEVWSQQGAGTEVDLTIPSSIAYRLYSAQTKFGFFRRKSETREQRS